MRSLALFVASVILGLYATPWSFELRRIITDVRRAHPNLLIVVVAIMGLAYLFHKVWSLTWAPKRSRLQQIAVGFIGNNWLLGRPGEIPRAQSATRNSTGEGEPTGAFAPMTSSPIIALARFGLGRLQGAVEHTPAPREEIHLSVVIPAYNERMRLPRTVLQTIHWCETRNLDFEVIIVDDGSRDETLALARLFEQNDLRIRAIACPHMGKGATVRMGMLNARGRFVLFMDADGATPLSEIPKLLTAIEEGHDVAVGSRIIQRSGEVEIKTSLHRRLIGRVFAFFVSLFAFEGIRDTQCGFKMFSHQAASAIFSRQRLVGFAFDVEILFIARQLSMSIAEIPVNWVAQPGSKVNLVTDSIKMLWDISHIRWLHRNVRATRSAGTTGQLIT